MVGLSVAPTLKRYSKTSWNPLQPWLQCKVRTDRQNQTDPLVSPTACEGTYLAHRNRPGEHKRAPKMSAKSRPKPEAGVIIFTFTAV